MTRLVIIPSEPILAYTQSGYPSWLEPYYNPEKRFNEVRDYSVPAVLAFFVVRRLVATNWEAPADSENKIHSMLDRPDLVEPHSASISPV